MVNDESEPYRSKAIECLIGSQSELANGRYNNAANRAYYAAYNAAIVALKRGGYTSEDWSHREVQRLISDQMIQRRKLLPSHFRRRLPDLIATRTRADYGLKSATRGQAETAVSYAEEMIRRILGVDAI